MESSLVPSDVEPPADRPLTLPYTLECEQVLRRDDRDRYVVAPSEHPRPHFTDKLFAPHPEVDTPESMCARMDSCRPSFVAPPTTMRRRLVPRLSVTAKRSQLLESPAALALSAVQRDAAGLSTDARTAAAAPVWNLDPRKLHATAHSASYSAARRPTSALRDGAGSLHGGVGPSESRAAAASASSPKVTIAELRTMSNQGRTRVWMRQQDAVCPPSLPAAMRSAAGARPYSAAPMKRLLGNRFEPPGSPALPYFSQRPRANSAGVQRSDGAHWATADPRPRTPTFLTDSATNTGGWRPKSRSPVPHGVPLRVALSEEQGCSAWLDDVLRQPIHSYKLVQSINAPSPPPATFTGSMEPAENARQQLQYAQARFEHERIVKQNELEMFLDYRARCRTVVAYKTVEEHADVDDSSPEAMAVTVRDRLLPLFEGERDQRSGYRRRKSAPAHRTEEPALRSVWTQRATEMALEEDTSRLCAALEAFHIDFPAAALSIQAMERLRSDLIRHVRNPPKTPGAHILTASELAQFLVSRARLTAVPSAHTDSMAVDDLADAMPSQAEAAFVRHAFSALTSL